MKKIFKNLATTSLIGVSVLAGISTINHIEYKSNSESKKELKTKNNNRYVYNLAPGQEFDPNSSEFNGYWNKLSVFEYGNYHSEQENVAWLLAIKSVQEKEGTYQIDFNYSFYSMYWTNTFHYVHMNLYNTSHSYETSFDLDPYFNSSISYTNHAYKSATVSVPKSSISDGSNLIFDVKFQNVQNPVVSYQVKPGNTETTFDLQHYEYLDEFYVESFNVIKDSITDEGFEFLIDIRLTNGENFAPWNNTLVLYSGGRSLETNLSTNYRNGLVGYSVSGLQSNTIYTNFGVGIIGFNYINPIENLIINTKVKNKIGTDNAGIIIGATIGGLILLLWIILLIILLVFFLLRRNKKEEYNVYNEYIALEDGSDNWIEMTKEDFKNQYQHTPRYIQQNNWYEDEYSPQNYNSTTNQNQNEEDRRFY